MNRDTATSAESLLEHRAFLTGLARALLGRDARVEDVVQDTFTLAVERGHTRRGPMRAWLAGIVRNLVGTLRRRDPARQRRESRAAREIRLPSTEDVVAREESRRRVLKAVLSLKEPYREAILYRYYEDLPPREIAVATGWPVETVRTRIRRALVLLRERLDADHAGSRKTWMLALLPLAGLRLTPAAAAGTATAATSLGVLAMTTKTKFALGALFMLLLFGSIWLSQRGGEPVAPPDPVPDVPIVDGSDIIDGNNGPGAEFALDADDGSPVAPDEALLGAHRAAVKAALSGKGPPDARGPFPGRVSSKESDQPVVGAKITVRWDYTRSGGRWPRGGVYEWTVVTDHRGEFRFEDLPAGHYRLVADHSDYAPRGLSGVEVKASGEVESFPVHLLQDPSKLGTVAGVVLDPYGNAIVGVEVVVHTFTDLIRRSGTTESNGSYRVDRLLPGRYRVSIVRPAEEGGTGKLWERTRMCNVQPGDVTRMDFRGSGTLTGILLDADGAPVADAAVVFWPLLGDGGAESRRGRTGKDGRFEIADGGVGRRRIIVGLGSASAYLDEIDLSGADREIEIRLEAGEIVGSVRLTGDRPPYMEGAFPGIVVYPLVDGVRGPTVASGGVDVAGAFRMRGLPSGRYRILVHTKGYRPLSADVTIDRGTSKVTQKFELVKLVLGSVRITVTDPDGSPVSDIRMGYGELGVLGRSVNRSMPSPGVYVCRMEVGKWGLALSGDRFRTKVLEVEVKPDVETKLEAEMERK